MAKFVTGYPKNYGALILACDDEIASHMSRLENKTLPPAKWEKEMRRTMTKYAQAARMLGSDQEKLVPKQKGSVKKWLSQQFKYLHEFRLELKGEFQARWNARARMYGSATYTQYWEGQTEGFDLPGQPGEGTECYSNCHCSWERKWLNKKKGNINFYWRLGSTEHCPTCRDRSRAWNPVRFRLWVRT